MADIREQISEVLYRAIADTMNKPAAGLSDSTDLVADLGVKSVNLVRIVATIEDEFDLSVSFQEFRRRNTIGELIDYLVQLHES